MSTTTPLPRPSRSGSIPWHIQSAAKFLVGAGPSFPQLLRGVPFQAGNAEADGADLADWLLEHPGLPGQHETKLRQHLGQVTCIQTPQVFADAAAACRDASTCSGEHGMAFQASAILFDFFGACIGGRDAALRVAAEAVALNAETTTTEQQALENGIAALGWLWVAAHTGPDRSPANPRSLATRAGQRMFDGMVRARRYHLRPVVPADLPLPEAPAGMGRTTDVLQESSEEDDNTDYLQRDGETVVLRAIGNSSTVDGVRVLKTYGNLVNAPLPLVPTPDLAAVRRELLQTFPHASEAIDCIVGELVGRDYVQLPPILLVGPPGAGKTALATSLLKALDLPFMLYPCGGASDSALGGTSRRWSTGEPSVPAALLASHRIASPGIVLDELDKPGSGDQNGRLHDALLGMLEPSTASRWHDPYFEADVDLSHVVWLATANAVDSLPRPLRDRCRILRVPAPGLEHLPDLSAALLRRAYAARDLDIRWASPLDGVELRAVAEAWRGGSIRQLARLLDGVMAARNHAPTLN